MGRLNELRLIARVAQMYHVEGKRQAEIARDLRMSQATVSRMLKRAEQEDIVRTTVIPPQGTFAELETALREKYNLPEAIVVDCSEDRDGAIMARIGEAAAHFLEVTLQPGDKSFTDAEIKAVADKVVTAAAKLGAVLRG